MAGGGRTVSGDESPKRERRGGCAADYLRDLSEFERKTLISNMTDELAQLPADLLEKVLVLFTQTDLTFGRDVTSAMGGMW